MKYKYLPIWREFQIENTSGIGNIIVGRIVFPFGNGIYRRIHFAVQTTLIAIIGPKTVFPVTQIGVTEVGAPSALEALHTVWIVERHAHVVSVRRKLPMHINDRTDGPPQVYGVCLGGLVSGRPRKDFE